MDDGFTPVYSYAGDVDVVLEVSVRARPDGGTYRHHRLRVGRGGGAVVVARRDGRILFGRTARVAAGAVLLELPRGFGEDADAQADDPGVEAGLRELAEETGVRVERAVRVGGYVLDSSIYPQEVAVVECVVAIEPEGPTDGEMKSVEWVDEREVDALIASGAVRDAHSLAALTVWRATRGEQE